MKYVVESLRKSGLLFYKIFNIIINISLIVTFLSHYRGKPVDSFRVRMKGESGREENIHFHYLSCIARSGLVWIVHPGRGSTG
jgi:hypothetical protein